MNYQVMPETEVIIQRIRSKRINPVYRFPSVSIFMPFDPKMGMKNKLTSSLSKANDKVVSELNNKYPGEMSLLVIQKLKTIIKNLNFNTHKILQNWFEEKMAAYDSRHSQIKITNH